MLATTFALVNGLFAVATIFAQDAAPKPPVAAAAPTPLNPQKTVLLDRANRRVVVKSEVVLREGLLELLLCIKRTKEHEAILAVDAEGKTIHAALLALGLMPGSTVRFQPDYQPARGPKLDITLRWTDADGKEQTAAARTWIRRATRKYFIEKLDRLPADVQLAEDDPLRYDEKHRELFWYGPMSAAQRDGYLKRSKDAGFQKIVRKFHDDTVFRELASSWLFVGSGFQKDSATGEEYYLAESGDLICTANFVTAMIDVEQRSSATNETLEYEAYTERIPPIGTKVQIELSPEKPVEK